MFAQSRDEAILEQPPGSTFLKCSVLCCRKLLFRYF